jgi:DNA-binding MarR family transcriptional regulator
MEDKRPDDDASYLAIERSLVAIRRSQTRRTLAKRARTQAAQPQPDQSHAGHAAWPHSERDGDSVPADGVVELLDAIEAAAARMALTTVTEAADALGIDQPRASRLAAQAIDAGLVTREADQQDGRRSLLALTPAGQRILTQVHDFRRQAVIRAIAHWTPADRETFSRLLERFVADFSA